MRYGLERLSERDEPLVFLEGSPAYDPWMTGTLVYSRVFCGIWIA